MERLDTVAIAIVAVAIAGFIVMSTDFPGGPSRDLEGIVKGTAVDSREGASPQVATVVVAEAGEVRASVNPGVFVHPGQAVRVREHQRIISGAKSYEVFAVKDAK